MSFHEQSHQTNSGFPLEPQSDDSVLQYHDTNRNRPFSIDLSLELERQLDMEAMSPAATQTEFPHSSQTSPPQKRESLDPHVLASIIMQLRQSLEAVTNERDNLVNLLSSAHSKEAQLKDALELMTEKATSMEEELNESRRQIKNDEDAIVLLRSKVEESRRGLMRLQTESRRQSTSPMVIDMSRAGLPSFGSGPPSSKRASFAPITGSITSRPQGHRRMSSNSDSNSLMISDSSALSSPQVSTFSENTLAPSSANPNTSRRFSGMFRHGSPPQLELPPQQDSVSVALETLRRELRTTKDELEGTKNELSESNEAREASEMCVKALREFIAEHNIGVEEAANRSDSASVKLPLLPTMTTGEEIDSKKAGGMGGTGWGFKLWKVETTAKNALEPPSGMSGAASSPVVYPTPQISTPSGIAPLSRKLGGFFGSRTSVSSATSNTSNSTSQSQLQTNAATSKARRDSINSTSDTSSVVEPISPNEVSVVVTDVTVLSEPGSSGGSPDGVQGRELGHESEKATGILG